MLLPILLIKLRWYDIADSYEVTNKQKAVFFAAERLSLSGMTILDLE